MAKKITEKTAGISLAGFQPRAKEVPAVAPAVAAPMQQPAAVQPAAAVTGTGKPFTGAGIFMSAISGKDGLSRELAEAQARLKQFEGAKIARLLDPAMVHASKWANRSEESFRAQAFVDLKAEIASTGGNVQPIVVRPREDALDTFELAFGHRRHRACLELGLPVLALIEELNDVELFSHMDRENRQRADLRPFEQGMMYARALDEGLFPSMRKMCDYLGVDVGNASKAIVLARLPAPVLACFPSPLELQQAWATPLSAALQKNPDQVLARAKAMATAASPVSAGEAFKQLVEEGVVSNHTPAESTVVVQGVDGRSGTIRFNGRKKSFDIRLNGLDERQIKAIESAVKKLLN